MKQSVYSAALADWANADRVSRLKKTLKEIMWENRDFKIRKIIDTNKGTDEKESIYKQ